MRIIVWNMAAGFGYDADRHQRAWEYLRELDPDIALLQEAVPPAWATGAWGSVEAAPKYAGRVSRPGGTWGCAIVTRTADLRAFVPTDATPWLGDLWGCAVVARLETPEPLWLASVHSNAHPIAADRFTGKPGPSRRCDDRDVWEVEVLSEELLRVFAGGRFLVGGDLNSALLFDKNYGGQSNARLFTNLADAGFQDLRFSHFPDEQRTFFKDGRGPYQLDHVFADLATSALTTSWRVVPEPAAVDSLSDHAPIEICVEL